MRSVPPVLVLLALVGCQPDTGITKFNNEPVATITSHADGDSVNELTTVTLRGTVSDTNDSADQLTASWYTGARELCAAAPVESDGSTTCDAVLQLGESVVTLQGQDPDNAIGTDDIAFEVLETGTPTASIVTPTSDGTYYSDVEVLVDAVVADTEDDASELVVVWTDGDGAEIDVDNSPDGDGSLSGALQLAEGAHTLRLDVTDSTGKTSGTSVEFTVGGPNNAPTCAIESPLDGAPIALGATVDLVGDLSDPDVASDLLTAAWSSDVDGALGGGAVESDGTTTLSVSTLSFGAHTLTLTGTDEAGATCTATTTVTVGAGPEIELSAPLEGDLYNEGEAVTFMAVVSDDATAADLLVVGWTDDLDGELDTTPADATGLVTFDLDTLSVGDHVVTLDVTDEDGFTSSATVTFTINGLPAAPDISIAPSAPGTDDDLVVTVDTDSVDPEGDAVTYTYAWTVDGAATAYTSTTVPASATSHGEVWEVTVTPNDGSGDGTGATAAVAIENGAPTVASATLTPDPAYEGDTLTCTAGATSDVDGDTVSTAIAWEVDGVLVAATTSTLGDTWWDRGDTVTCTVTPNDGAVDGTSVTSNAVTIDNSTPSITGVDVTPEGATVADTLSCETSGFSDADGDAEATTFEWFVGGVSVGTGSTLAAGYSAGDTVTCTATPSDGTYDGTAISDSVVIENTPPVLASVTLTPASPSAADTLTCTPGSTTDADGTSSFTYTYAWTVGGATITATGSTLSGEFVHGDSVRCSVTPNDGTDDGNTVASSAVTILNIAPEITSVTLSPSAPSESSTITATVASTDLDGDAVTYTYSWFVDGSAVGATGSTLTGTYFDRDDTVYVSVVPTDGSDDGAAVASSSVTVVNSAPSLTSASISPTTAYVSSTLTCTASGYSDADGDTNASTVVWTIGGTVVGTGSSLSGVFASGDEALCTVTPYDGTDTGTAVTASVTITNSAPSLASVSLTPTAATESSTLTCTPGATTDGDGTTSFTYTYAWYVDGALIAPTTATITGTWFDNGDDVSCAATPSDGTTSGTAVVSNEVTIGNSAPTVTAVTLTPTSPTVSSTLTCAATGTDDDGDTVSFTYAWYVEGAAVAATGATLTSTYFDAGDDVYCRATPTDGTDSGTAMSSSTVTITNTAPVMASVTLTPTTAYESSTLTCTPSATDTDGDTVSYTYAWYVDSSVVAPTTSTLTGTYFDAGDSVYCRATPTDGTDSGTAMSSSAVTISNTAPVVSAVTLTPTTAYESSTLTCTPTTTDADGTTSFTYTYNWYVNGSLIAPVTSTLTGTYFAKSNTVYCTASASDGTTSSSAVSSSTVTISNTVPVASSVTLSPTLVYTNSTITATPSATDADGDTISYTYAWYVNGSVIAATSSTLSGATYFSKSNTVYASVTPSDGTASGSAVSSSSVTVLNTAPTAPTVEITPEDPEAGLDALVCALDTSSTDVDGDTVAYTFTWTRNGSSYTGDTDTSTTSTVPASATSDGDDFICTATPSDGSTSGTAGTATVEVLGASYTIGYATVFASPGTGYAGTNYNLGQQITVSSAVDLYQLGVLLRLADTDSIRMALYTDSGGSPTTLVAYTALTSLAGSSDGDAIEMDVVGGPVSVAAGTYWITINASDRVYFGYTTVGASGNTIKYNSLSTSSAFPSSFGSASSYTGQFLNHYMVVR